MGILISRLWRKRSTEEVLQRLEDERAALEETKVAMRRHQHRLRPIIMAYSLLLYGLAAGFMYWRGLPGDTSSRVMAAATLLLFPTVMYLLKGMLSWYYERKISKSEVRMSEIKKKKEQILEEVQEKETYKVARKILEKYAPDQLRRSSPRTTALASNSEEEGSLRHRQQLVPAVPGRPPFTSTPRPGQGPPRPGPTPGDPARTPMLTGSGRFSGRTPLVQSPVAMRGRGLPMPGGPGRSGPPLPRPVLPRERGYMDRMMDYLVGDGPANRYALICSQCQSHNGMALQEEFQYLAFRCCYCYAWNPARKQRPTAPRLPAAPTSDSMHESDTTETTDSEPEIPAATGPSPAVEETTSGVPPEEGALPADPADATSAPASETPVPAVATPVPAGITPVPAGVTPLPAGATPLPAGATPVPTGATPVPVEGSDGTTVAPAGVVAASIAEVEEPTSGTADALVEANTSEAGRQLRVSSLTPDAGAESAELGSGHPAVEFADETLPSDAVLVPPPVEEYAATALSEEAASPASSPASLPTTRPETSPDAGQPAEKGPGSAASPGQVTPTEDVPFIDDSVADS